MLVVPVYRGYVPGRLWLVIFSTSRGSDVAT